jgi:hypothetical protein
MQRELSGSFFEKKNQKTSVILGMGVGIASAHGPK